ncbi:hypothetical protein fugu_007738 [Takifugu bimaculatus]|uniref:Ig-like domain-containing protein n=1 Tax=Takifugu bimaculatus TaxID=433685 RepID=A0A4Z2AZU5_9TELE|nr:hypothetical protein fugu_007738 [Takifugu bimaculatus]
MVFSMPPPLSSLLFVCFPGSPPPVITWSKLRAPLPWKHTVDNGVLTLTGVGRQDSGQYICNATNEHGYSEAYTQMEVESPPYATSLPDQVKLRPGDSLVLQCLAHGSHPIQFEWSRVGRPSLPAGTETTKAGKLMIARLRTSDSGTYKCVATNHIGTSEALAKVVVRGLNDLTLALFHLVENTKEQNSELDAPPSCDTPSQSRLTLNKHMK